MTKLPNLNWTRPRDFRATPFTASKVTPKGWMALAHALAAERFTMMSLWGEAGAVCMALYDATEHRVAVARVPATKGTFPSVGVHHAPAQRLERAIADLFGFTPEGAEDTRPWLDHGKWEITHPLGAATKQKGQPPYPFLPVEGESLNEVPVGPVHAGIIEPGHFRFTAQGETVVRLEERFGYTHKGIDFLMQGATLERGAELAARTSGDSTVAYSFAFAQAAESALGVDVPVRAFALRGIMAELERLANLIGDIGAVCNDAAFALMLAQTSAMRERILRAAETVFGNRFMKDLIVPGGVSVDLDADGEKAIHALLDDIRDQFPALIKLYDNTASLLDRTVASNRVSEALARRFGAGGYVGRAAGRDFDTRRDMRYAPYDMLRFEVPIRQEGDVNARIWIRIHEVEQSCVLISQLLNTLPAGPVRADFSPAGAPRAGLGLVEGFRGDILIWLSLDADGLIERCHMREPSWFQWPLIEAAIEGNIIADFPLGNKSFNGSYSGSDL